MAGLPILALTLAAAQAPAAPAFTLRIPSEDVPSASMSVVAAPRVVLTVQCNADSGVGLVSVAFPREMGDGMAFPVSYSFDGGAERNGQWMGLSILAMMPRRTPEFAAFFRALRGSRSFRISAPVRGGDRQEVVFSYTDPDPMLEELDRHCGLSP